MRPAIEGKRGCGLSIREIGSRGRKFKEVKLNCPALVRCPEAISRGFFETERGAIFACAWTREIGLDWLKSMVLKENGNRDITLM